MSELSLGTLSGLAANSFVVDVASGSTLDLSNATDLPAGALPAGSILQVVSTTKTDTFSAAVTTPAFTSNVTGLEATITPTSTSSKILVQLSITGSRTGNFAIVVPRLMRDSTPIGIATGTSLRAAAGGVLSIVSAHPGSMGVATTDYLDSPNTTSSITYGVQLTGISGTQTVYVNRSAGDTDSTSVARAVSTITLMEVAG